MPAEPFFEVTEVEFTMVLPRCMWGTAYFVRTIMATMLLWKVERTLSGSMSAAWRGRGRGQEEDERA